MPHRLRKFYTKLILDHPLVVLLFVCACIAFAASYAPQFRLDASSESLSLENDLALQYYRQSTERYGSTDYLLVAYIPGADLFAAETLMELQTLREDLAALERVDSIISILDVPLINSPPIELSELGEQLPTLLSEGTNKELAKQELLTSPIYQDLLISKDATTTALLVTFDEDTELLELIKARDALKMGASERELSVGEKQSLAKIERQYKIENARSQARQQSDIASVRAVLSKYKDNATIYLGGVPMIVADSIDYIASDLKTFGLAILCLIIVLLSVIFRKLRWVVLPMITCFCVGITMIGFLGMVNWPATIVSANFVSLLLIFTLSFCVHQIVRYHEFQAEMPDADQRTLVGKMALDISVPCAYMAFTTAVGFTSLAVSDIRPVIDFGWMMTVGIIISFLITFTLIPAGLMFFKPPPFTSRGNLTGKITGFFVSLIQRHGRPILVVFAICMLLALWGLTQLYVQNRFIDYYKSDTDIYQGMEVIDTKLGGTTPLDIIIGAPKAFLESQQEETQYMIEEGFYEEGEGPGIEEGYWFGGHILGEVAAIHEYLDSLPETGKLLSFHTTVQTLQDLDEEWELDRFTMGVLYNKLPGDVRDILLTPYISKDGNQLRFSIRAYESADNQDRQALLEKIRAHLTTELGLADEQVHMTGILVLYNNVLETLFESQILTVGVVFITMFVIFLLLFRNIYVAAVAIIPNITIVAVVLGIIGWLGIPLDIMTITIAAICFGMADDNTIHYIHRFRKELMQHGDYQRAMTESHDTIGRAMYYTAITIMSGFSVLAFSNFMPTIYFGLLTAFSVLVALLANLTFLPLLVVLLKPFGRVVPDAHR